MDIELLKPGCVFSSTSLETEVDSSIRWINRKLLAGEDSKHR